MTFSIAAHCPETGQLGIAISSSSIAVGARCPWLLTGVGAVSSQNITLPLLGQQTLRKLAQGMGVKSALQQVLTSDQFSEYRQVIVINNKGETAMFSGDKSLGTYHAREGENCVAGGNLLADIKVIDAMISAFENTSGQLADRLLVALQAAMSNGGEAGPVHSAAMEIVDNYSWPVVDLRVDWDDKDPIATLATLWQAYEPQMLAYITRAIDPSEAPSYGVPGDE